LQFPFSTMERHCSLTPHRASVNFDVIQASSSPRRGAAGHLNFPTPSSRRGSWPSSRSRRSFKHTSRATEFRFVISGMHRRIAECSAAILAAEKVCFPDSTRQVPQLAESLTSQIASRSQWHERCSYLPRPGHAAQTPCINNPVVFGADLNGLGKSQAVFTNTTAIRPIDLEVNMAAIHFIWLAFVAVSTVFAASLWATIIAEFWRANRLRLLALRSLGHQPVEHPASYSRRRQAR
jgi:hypothetical protein